MKGLRIPVGVSSNGGAAMIYGDENDKQIISVSLGSSDNENAFQQDISLGEGMIFDLDDASIRAKITRRVYSIFDEFKIQKRFKLKKDTLIKGCLKYLFFVPIRTLFSILRMHMAAI